MIIIHRPEPYNNWYVHCSCNPKFSFFNILFFLKKKHLYSLLSYTKLWCVMEFSAQNILCLKWLKINSYLPWIFYLAYMTLVQQPLGGWFFIRKLTGSIRTFEKYQKLCKCHISGTISCASSDVLLIFLRVIVVFYFILFYFLNLWKCMEDNIYCFYYYIICQIQVALSFYIILFYLSFNTTDVAWRMDISSLLVGFYHPTSHYFPWLLPLCCVSMISYKILLISFFQKSCSTLASLIFTLIV